jgi:CheY-like chemotaxis protein
METIGNPGEVLVVDDEPAVALAIKTALKFCGYLVTAVPDAQSALDDIQAHPSRFQVVLSDHNMPGLGGLGLVQALRVIGFGGRIVILSGYLTRDNEEQYRDLGVDQILAKPFNLDRLRQALHSVLNPDATAVETEAA